MIEKEYPQLSVSKQCDMINIARSSYYDHAKGLVMEDASLVKRIETIYNKHPVYGSRRIKDILQRQGTKVNRKKVQRLMHSMNIQGICPKPNLSTAHTEHKKYPFIARDHPIERINQVWSADITYLKTRFGMVYLVAVIDWHSRFILSWSISNFMGEEFCIEALESALNKGIPKIFNTDQGSQFTGNAFLSVVIKNAIRPSMDGKGRATDNAQIERFWRSVKWEEVYLYEPQNYVDLQKMIGTYISYYNHDRPHQSLDYKTPSEVHFDLEKKHFNLNAQPVYTKEELKYVSHW